MKKDIDELKKRLAELEQKLETHQEIRKLCEEIDRLRQKIDSLQAPIIIRDYQVSPYRYPWYYEHGTICSSQTTSTSDKGLLVQ